MDPDSLNTFLGLALGTLFTAIGTSVATVKSAHLVTYDVKTYSPIMMAGTLVAYNLIVSLFTITKYNTGTSDDNALMAACLITGFSNMFSGITMGIMSEKAAEYNVGLVVMHTFTTSWGLLGLIVSVVIIGNVD